MTSEDNFARWAGVGVPLLLCGGLLLIWGLHARLKLSVPELAGPVATFVGAQILYVIPMFLVGRRGRERNEFGPTIAMTAGYCWASGILVLHYGGKWGLLKADSRDYVPFTVLILMGTLVIAALIRFGGIVPPKN